MSLLMEALKRAERAKQQAAVEAAAKTSTQSPAISPPVSPGKLELQLEPAESAVAEAAETKRSESLPALDLANLEISLEPYEAAAPASASGKDERERGQEPTLLRDVMSAASTASAATAAAISSTGSAGNKGSKAQRDLDSQRTAVKQVFAVKQTGKTSHVPFFLVLGLQLTVAAAGGTYVYHVIQPPPSIARTPPPLSPQLATQLAAVAKSEPVPALVPGIAQAQMAPVFPMIGPVPPTAPVTGKSGADKTPSSRRSEPRLAPLALSTVAESGSAIRIKRVPSPQSNPSMIAASEAALVGDNAKAAQLYRQQLAVDPRDRDAMLGLAAVASRTGQRDSAESLYRRVLELDPKNIYAQAEMAGLSAQQNPVGAESHLKNLIATNPEATFLNFKLGNVLAAQNRWSEAQQAYFKAHAADQGNPDYAFNLAVCLEQMNQPKLALQYYQHALTLMETRSANFDRNQVRARVQELSR